MHFDVPKFVRSPGCDHGHDEESRNGREVKIHILQGYIRTSEWFRVIQLFFGVPESYGNSLGEVNGPYWALVERGKKGHKVARASPCPNRIGQGVGPPFPSPSPSFPSFLLRKGKGILLGFGSPSRTPYTLRAPRRADISLPPLYTWVGATPKAHQVFF